MRQRAYSEHGWRCPERDHPNAFDTGELTEGPHQIRLWAHDEAGNKQTEPTVVTIEIDQTPPPKPTMVLWAAGA